MIRKLLKTTVVALAAVLTMATLSDAAPRRVVHHRVRHSTRVTSRASTRARKKVVRHRRVHRVVKHRATTKPR
jgi:hypothetical protein